MRREFSKQECNNIQDATPTQPVKHTCVSDQTRARATLHSRSWPLGSCRALEFTYCTQHLPTVIGGSATLPAPTYSRCIRNRERGCCPRRWMRGVVCFYSCVLICFTQVSASPGYSSISRFPLRLFLSFPFSILMFLLCVYPCLACTSCSAFVFVAYVWHCMPKNVFASFVSNVV